MVERYWSNNGGEVWVVFMSHVSSFHPFHPQLRCLPPYRGRLCELEDKPRKTQRLKAVIHYMMAETARPSEPMSAIRLDFPDRNAGPEHQERDLLDMERSLKSLWLRYNQGTAPGRMQDVALARRTMRIFTWI